MPAPTTRSQRPSKVTVSFDLGSADRVGRFLTAADHETSIEMQELRGGRMGGEVATSGKIYRGAQGIEAEQIAEPPGPRAGGEDEVAVAAWQRKGIPRERIVPFRGAYLRLARDGVELRLDVGVARDARRRHDNVNRSLVRGLARSCYAIRISNYQSPPR